MDQIGTVVRTGGSAQIPRFVELLERIFGQEKVVLSDVFSSVTAGLAVRAWLDELP
jgi:cell division ATPase FtsA